MRPRLLAAALLAVAPLAGCVMTMEDNTYDITLRNTSERPVNVLLLSPDGGAERTSADLAPGGAFTQRFIGDPDGIVQAQLSLERARAAPEPISPAMALIVNFRRGVSIYDILVSGATITVQRLNVEKREPMDERP